MSLPLRFRARFILTRHREVMIDTPVDGFMIGALRTPTGPPKPRTRTRALEPRTRTSDLTPEITKIQYESEQVRPRFRNSPPAELMTFDDLRRDRKIARDPVSILKSHEHVTVNCIIILMVRVLHKLISMQLLTSHKSSELSRNVRYLHPQKSAH